MSTHSIPHLFRETRRARLLAWALAILVPPAGLGIYWGMRFGDLGERADHLAGDVAARIDRFTAHLREGGVETGPFLTRLRCRRDATIVAARPAVLIGFDGVDAALRDLLDDAAPGAATVGRVKDPSDAARRIAIAVPRDGHVEVGIVDPELVLSTSPRGAAAFLVDGDGHVERRVGTAVADAGAGGWWWRRERPVPGTGLGLVLAGEITAAVVASGLVAVLWAIALGAGAVALRRSRRQIRALDRETKRIDRLVRGFTESGTGAEGHLPAQIEKMRIEIDRLVEEIPAADVDFSENRRLIEVLRAYVERTRSLMGAVSEGTEGLRRSEEHLRVTLDSIAEAVITTDRCGIILRMNPVAVELTGWAAHEAEGSPLEDVLRVDDEDPGSRRRHRSANRALRDGEVSDSNVPVIIFDRHGRRLKVTESCAPIRAGDGEILGSVLVLRDVTEQLLLEEKLHQAQKLEAIGQLAGGVAHDFNNILTGIMGYAERLLASLEEGDERRTMLQRILSSADRAANLTGSLLDFSRKRDRMVSSVDLHALVEETVELLRQSFDPRVRIVCDLRARSATVDGDQSQLQNAMMNIALNARDAMPKGGELRITSTNMDLAGDRYRGHTHHLPEGEYIEIAISDQGTGIPKEILGNIFEPFFTTKDVGKGTGLGLATVYGVATAHGGTVVVESEDGVGSAFRLIFPVVETDGQYDSTSSAVRGSWQGAGRVLLADDEEAIRELVRDILEQKGFEVTAAADGAEAVDLYRRSAHGFDLVLLDMTMPNMNGEDAFRAIQAEDPDARVILTTGFADREEIASLLEDGVTDYLIKPYRGDRLVKMISEALGPRPETTTRRYRRRKHGSEDESSTEQMRRPR